MNYILKGLMFGVSVLSSFYIAYYKSLLPTIIHETIIYYSYVEINIKKHLDLLYNVPIVKDSIYKLQIYMFNEVELVKSNFVFGRCSLKDVVKYNPYYFDFFIFTDYYTLNKIVSKNVNISLDVENCDYKFYIFQLKISNVELIDDEKLFIAFVLAQLFNCVWAFDDIVDI